MQTSICDYVYFGLLVTASAYHIRQMLVVDSCWMSTMVEMGLWGLSDAKANLLPTGTTSCKRKAPAISDSAAESFPSLPLLSIRTWRLRVPLRESWQIHNAGYSGALYLYP